MNDLHITSEKPNKENTKKTKNTDDLFNYNCAILAVGLFFLISWMLLLRKMG